MFPAMPESDDDEGVGCEINSVVHRVPTLAEWNSKISDGGIMRHRTTKIGVLRKHIQTRLERQRRMLGGERIACITQQEMMKSFHILGGRRKDDELHRAFRASSAIWSSRARNRSIEIASPVA